MGEIITGIVNHYTSECWQMHLADIELFMLINVFIEKLIIQ